jgi:uncharacterized membrane protein YdbT with pleckstrin-like domain
MEEIVVRPSIKLLKTAYGVAIFTLGCLGIAKAMNLMEALAQYWWIAFLPPLLYLCWIGSRHISSRLTRMVINDDRVRYEAGFLSKQMHAIDVAKVHDVRVEQSVKQRVIGVGNISVETANSGSRIHMTDVDNPQQIADRILQLSRKALQQRANHASQQ